MRHGVAALACLVGSCARPHPPAQPAQTVALSAAAPAPSRAVPPPVDVEVIVRAPLHASYTASLLGAPKPALAVVVRNHSTLAVDVSDLQVHLAAARDGVPFRCTAIVGSPTGEHEPAALTPGESFVFERDLDCALPLVGAYAVRVGVSFGHGDWSTPRNVRSFTLTVTALPNVAPRELEGVPGLWVAMGASGVVATGTTQEARARTVVALVNATRKPIEVPRMHLVLRVYRAGNPIPCEDEPIPLATPPVLGPGDTHYEPIVVSCLGLSVPGTYEIAARLVVPRGDEGARDVSLGRLRVEVVTNPLVLNVDRWR